MRQKKTTQIKWADWGKFLSGVYKSQFYTFILFPQPEQTFDWTTI